MHTITFTSMELALNLTWVCLALFGFALLGSDLSQAAEHPAKRPTNRQKIMAMSCALIILFFVVSMTDDLHNQEIFVEETKFLRITNGGGLLSMAAVHSTMTPFFLAFLGFTHFSFTFALPAIARLLDPVGVPLAVASSSRPFCGRAPPAQLI